MTDASKDASKDSTRGARLLVESHDDLPMVWSRIAIGGGAAGDPIDGEGFCNHLATLVRRGAGARDRKAMDTALDELGASLDISAHRDAIVISGVCLERHLDRLVEVQRDILAAPHLDGNEHDKLLRETAMTLDEIRDDDATVAARFFNRHCVPGHPYARSVMGTEATIERIELERIRAAHGALFVPGNMVVGLAGAIDEDTATRVCADLVRELPGDSAGQSAPLVAPPVESPPMPRGRRVLLVDKPERSQCQIVIGHLGPRYGHPDTPALTLVETIFGGMFSSRLMQEIRVERGWSYGADCYFYKGRGPHWFTIHLAPPAEVAADALALALSMFEELVQDGVTEDELAFAKRYLAGNLPFKRATPYARLRERVNEQIFGLADNYAAALPELVTGVTLDEANRAARRWLHPADTLSVVVGTADSMVSSLARATGTDIEVVAYDSY